MSDLFLALDFGGTKHSAALLEEGEKQWTSLERAFSPADANADYDLKTMLALARRVLAGGQPTAVGVSFGGPVEFEAGRVRLSHHVPGWENVPLKALLEEALQAPVVVDNDANVAAWGEYIYGAGRGSEHLLYVTVSTGVGGGWILNGRLWRGAQGMAGEIGHTVVDPAGPLCLCGKRGCVERLASGPYMVEQAQALLAERPGEGRILLQLASNQPETITGLTLSEAAARGDVIAQHVLERGARALGLSLGNAANLVNPERVVLGGGVTKAGARWWQQVRETVQATLLPEIDVAVVPAELGDDAPLWGAVALAKQLK